MGALLELPSERRMYLGDLDEDEDGDDQEAIAFICSSIAIIF